MNLPRLCDRHRSKITTNGKGIARHSGNDARHDDADGVVVGDGAGAGGRGCRGGSAVLDDDFVVVAGGGGRGDGGGGGCGGGLLLTVVLFVVEGFRCRSTACLVGSLIGQLFG